MPALSRLKRDLCEIGHRMWQRGYCAGNDGNLSCRLSGNQVLATPTGISKGFLTPAMLPRVDLQGHAIGRPAQYPRTSEIFLHLAIYRKRSDVNAVVHAHAPHATAFACSGVALPQGVYPEAEVCLGLIPTVPYSKPGYQELGEKVAQAIGGETHAVLLGNHGVVTFGQDLSAAYYKLEMLESYCQILLVLKQIGRVNLLRPAQLAELLAEQKRPALADHRPAGAPEQRFFRGMNIRRPR